MSLFNDKEVLRQIIISHYDKPNNKVEDNFDCSNYQCFHNKSLSCIDDIEICLLIENKIIKDAKFKGIGCAISSASSDIFCDMLKNKNIDQVQCLLKNYYSMINNEPFDKDLMEELIAFSEIHNQPNRLKCSLIGFDAINNILNNKDK